MFDLLLILGVVLLVVAGVIYRRQRERVLMERLKQAGNDPNLILSELDQEIEQDRERAEFWKKQSGKPLL